MSKKYKIIAIFLWFIAVGFNVFVAAVGAYSSLLPYFFPADKINVKLRKIVKNPIVLVAAIIIATISYCLAINTAYAQYSQYCWILVTALAISPLIDLASNFIGIKEGSTIEHIIIWTCFCGYLGYRIFPMNIKTLAIIWEGNKYPLVFMGTTLFASTVIDLFQNRKSIKKETPVFNLVTDLHKTYINTPSHPLYNNPLYNKGKKPVEELQVTQPPVQSQTPTPEKPEQEKRAELPGEKPALKQEWVSKQDNVKKEESGNRKWKHSNIEAACNYLWDKYSDTFAREPEAWEVILSLFEILDSNEADISSVRSNTNLETNDPVFLALGKINLRQHTLNVLKAILSLVQRDSIIEGTSLTAALIAALGHDLGKLARFTDYVTGDHPKDGSKIVSEFTGQLPNKNLEKMILEAIEKHHVAEVSHNIVHDLLRQADFNARNIETKKVMGGGNASQAKQPETKPQPAGHNKNIKTQTLNKHRIVLSEDFPLDVLISKIREYTNHPKTTVQKFWKSVSQPDGYIYMKLDLFDEIIREVAFSYGITDYDMIRGGDKIFGAARMTAVYSLLRKNDMAHPLIKGDYFANTWHVQDAMYNWKGNLVLVGLGFKAAGVDSIQILETERQKTHRLKHIKICGLARKQQS